MKISIKKLSAPILALNMVICCMTLFAFGETATAETSSPPACLTHAGTILRPGSICSSTHRKAYHTCGISLTNRNASAHRAADAHPNSPANTTAAPGTNVTNRVS